MGPTALRIALFGRVRASRGDTEIPLGPHQQRAVLALLALASGDPIPIDEIIDIFWTQPPPTAVNTLRTYVKRLRAVLEPGRRSRSPSRVLPTVGTGYALCVDVQDVDVLRFRVLAEQARGARARGAHPELMRVCREALALYHAAPCADLPVLAGSPRLAVLNSQRQALVGWLLDAAIAVDRVLEALPLVQEAAVAQPLDELAQARLMHAYCAVGRRADGFAVYDATRRLLADALGVDPGEQLRAAYADLLRDAVSPQSHAPAAQTRPGDLAEAVAALPAGGIVNLVGPIGCGKSTLLADLGLPVADLAAVEPGWPVVVDPGGSVVAIDHADGPAAVTAVCRAWERSPAGRVLVVASRRPLRCLPTWPGTPTVTVPVTPWSTPRIAELARAFGVAGPAGINAVVRLSGGIPLIADRICRALLRGAPADVDGALVDGAAAEVLDRARRENPALGGLLARLALIGQGNEEQLDPGEFAVLNAGSLVTAGPGGLAVIEPYRSILEAAHRWRRPAAHRRIVRSAVRHRLGLLAVAGDDAARADLAEQSLWLTGNAAIREALFPVREPTIRVRRSTAADAEDVLRLTRRWAERGELDSRRCERVVGRWLAADPEGFQLAVDRDGTTMGTVATVAVAERTIDTMEPLLQAHSDRLAGEGGIFVGMAFCADAVGHAALLRSVLREGMASGKVTVVTFWPDYQRLSRALDFEFRGETRAEAFGCGSPLEVHTRSLLPAGLHDWLRKLTALGLGPTAPDPVALHVRHALSQLGSPRALAASPLVPLVGSDGTDLRERLQTGIETLAVSDDPAQARAGVLLLTCYLKAKGHAATARELGLSRATYYRRLRASIAALADQL